MNKSLFKLFWIFITSMVVFVSCKKKQEPEPGILQLVRIIAGSSTLDIQGTNKNIPIDKTFVVEFNAPLDTSSMNIKIQITDSQNSIIASTFSFNNDFSAVNITPALSLTNSSTYKIIINENLKGLHGETFPGVQYTFSTVNGKLLAESILVNGQNMSSTFPLRNIDSKKVSFEVSFTQALDPTNYQSFFQFSGDNQATFNLSPDHKKVSVTSSGKLSGFSKYYFTISGNLTSVNGFTFDGFSGSFFTALDSTPVFPILSDNDLLTLIEKQTFKYFWDFGHPSCGLARERNTSGDVVTIGGSGFGVMAIIIGMERGFITKTEGLNRIAKILTFLETCDRFHGAWPHWLNGVTGKTVPFSPKDDGGDLVETSFMIQGLITMRQYLNASIPEEKSLMDRINNLNNAVEYDWFTRNENVLYWHWSPTSAWATNLKLEGYNETLITYVLAATSETHPIPANAYKTGYTKNGAIKNGNVYYGYKLPLGESMGGPLFFTHYSFLGLDPRNLKDAFANYWEQNVNQSLINRAYCLANPKNFAGYGPGVWGLTASDNPWGYNAHSPGNDLGVITPTAAISSIPYTPEQSMQAIKTFYYYLGNKLWGNYGFYDAFSVSEGWWANSYLAIDQGPIICMIENYRTGLLWNLFMSAPEVKKGLDKLGFTY